MSQNFGKNLTVPRSELEQHLRDRIGFLVRDAAAYDAGEIPAAKQMAHSLRILLHDTRNSKSLLRQLGLMKIGFLNTAEQHLPRNLFSTCCLIAFKFDVPNGRRPWMIPRGDPAKLPIRDRLLFADWWTMPVVVARTRKRDLLFARKDLVLFVADKDGGSHVDDKLPQDYVALSRWNAIGITVCREGDATTYPIGNPVFPCVRQITHELLRSLFAVVPEEFPRPYESSVSSQPGADNPVAGVPTAWKLVFGRL